MVTFLQQSALRLNLLVLLCLALTGCGNSQRVNVDVVYYLDKAEVHRASVPVVSSSIADSGWPAGQFPSLEVTWNRAPEVQFHEVWIGFNSNDVNQREHLGYLHTDENYVRHATTSTNQKYMTINLQDIPSKRRRAIKQVTLVYRLEQQQTLLDSSVDFAFDDAAKSMALNQRAWFLATFPVDEVRDGERAVTDALKACDLSQYKDAGSLDTLAAAYAEQGNFELAVENQQAALQLLKDATGTEVSSYEARLRLYEQMKPYRQWWPLP